MAINQIKAGAILNYCVIALNTIVGILYTPYMLRMLGQSEYGIYSLATSVIAYLGIMDLGFGNAIVRYVAKFRAEGDIERQQNLLGMFSCIYIVIGIITSLLGVIFSFNVDCFFDKTMNDYELRQTGIIMSLLAVNLSITFLFNVYSSTITAYEDFVFQKVVQIIRIILNTLVMIALLSYGYKAIGLVVCQTIFNIFTQILNWYYFKYRLKMKIRFGYFDWKLFREIFSYSVWIFATFMIDRLFWSTGPFILGAEVGTVAVAIFSLSMTLENMYISFSISVSGVFFPRLTKMVAMNVANQEVSDLFIKIGRIQVFIVGIFLSAFIVFGKPFVILWAGTDYLESYYCSVILFIGHFIPLVSHLGIYILQAKNDMKFRTICLSIVTIICIIGQYFLSRRYGAVGCCVAIFVTLVIGQGIIMNIYYWKKHQIDIPKFTKEACKMLVVPILMTVLGIIFLFNVHINDSWIILLLSMICFCGIYVVLSYIFTLNDYERHLIINPFMRVLRR